MEIKKKNTTVVKIIAMSDSNPALSIKILKAEILLTILTFEKVKQWEASVLSLDHKILQNSEHIFKVSFLL